MSFIANIAFMKQGLVPEAKQFGSLWYDLVKHHACILLKGFRFGQFFAKPFDNVDAPYLEGDIVVATGDYLEGGMGKKEYMWCGWVWTCSDQRGVVYNGVFEIDPLPVIMQQQLRETDPDIRGKRKGIMLNIHLIDKENKHDRNTAGK
jgi:hypothetical protein